MFFSLLFYVKDSDNFFLHNNLTFFLAQLKFFVNF